MKKLMMKAFVLAGLALAIPGVSDGVALAAGCCPGLCCGSGAPCC